MNNNILIKTDILARAKLSWNAKSKEAKIKAGIKYQCIFDKYKFPANDWINEFDELTKYQQNIIVKGELIRFYDSLSNVQKTHIMRDFNLSVFSSKWYKLPGADKKTLLNSIIK